MKLSHDELSGLMFGSSGNPGYCETCDEVDEHAGCEPDAQNYTCPSCEEQALFGLEFAFMAGMVEVEE